MMQKVILKLILLEHSEILQKFVLTKEQMKKFCQHCPLKYCHYITEILKQNNPYRKNNLCRQNNLFRQGEKCSYRHIYTRTINYLPRKSSKKESLLNALSEEGSFTPFFGLEDSSVVSFLIESSF